MIQYPAMRRFPLFLLFFPLWAVSCGFFTLSSGPATPGSELYRDDFSDPTSGWNSIESEIGRAGYVKDAYLVNIAVPSVDFWSRPGLQFGDVRLEVEAAPALVEPVSRMGLICRWQDDRNFYFFSITSDGFYGIGKMKDGVSALLGSEQMQSHPAILTSGQVNHLRADCFQSLLILYVNDAQVGYATDEEFKTGDVGLLAGSFDQPDVDVVFDNFVVFQP